MILASYNVENMFDRAKAMNRESWAEGRPALEAHRTLNAIFNKTEYSAADKRRILELFEEHGLLRNDEGPLLILRKIRGQLIRRPRSGGPEIVADGRGSWIGWVELKTEEVRETATENTARVIGAINADVLGVVEAEDRTTLRLFNEAVIRVIAGASYAYTMVIDGNDDRGIDVGILTRAAFPISSIRTHIFDRDEDGVIFSRDCAEYEIAVPGGTPLWVLVNHFKSKGYGKQSDNDSKRSRQARRVRQIVDEHLAAGENLVAVLGDFNDFPAQPTLSALLREGSPLRDISEHPTFVDSGRPGTFGNCTESQKFDYLLLSPGLFERVQSGSYERRGMWGGKQGALWERFAEVREELDAASDHAAVWANIAL